MGEVMIEARGLSRRFGDIVAVDGLDLSVEAGHVYGLLGPNGAGKTTTVRMLAGLIAPSGGSARVAGLEVRQDEAALSRLHACIGLLTESPGMWERLSAARNLRTYADLYSLPEPERRVERYLRAVGLWERRHDAVAKFSKGMRQRLAIARALLHEPPVLFLDEPTSGLDPEAAAEVRGLIGDLRGEGRAVLLCTHNLEEAEKLSDRLGVFQRRLLDQGTAGELRRSVFGCEVIARFRSPDAPGRHLERAREVEGVLDVREEAGELVLRVRSPEEALPPLARALVDDDAELLHLGERIRSLEEVYLAILGRADD